MNNKIRDAGLNMAVRSEWSKQQYDQTMAQLAVLADSETFGSSERLIAFLRYIVLAELTGEAERLNQHSIAFDVLGRDENFDPSTDSIVRVEAGRLRSRLREYYAAEGASDSVRFELPKGRYGPVITLSESAVPHPEQTIQLLKTSDGTHIAYAQSGQGPPLVKTANWMTHLEYEYSSHSSLAWRHWWRALGQDHRLLRYDVRGCGLSDWSADKLTSEACFQDLVDVISAAKLERFPLLGVSSGVSTAIEYAVRFPEKVSHLILCGGFPLGTLARNQQSEKKEEVLLLRDAMKLGWGRKNSAFRQLFTSMFMPEATKEQADAFNELQRLSTSPEIAAKFWVLFHNVDVVDLLPQVKVPTLILHSIDDALIPFEQSRRMAAAIAGSRLIPLESQNHILFESEPAWSHFLKEVNVFLAGA